MLAIVICMSYIYWILHDVLVSASVFCMYSDVVIFMQYVVSVAYMVAVVAYT